MPVWCPAFEVRCLSLKESIEEQITCFDLSKRENAGRSSRLTTNTKAMSHPILVPKYIIIAALACLLVAAKSSALPANRGTVSAIRSVLSAQEAAWNRGDVDGFMDGYARSTATVFLSGDTVTRGWQTVRDRYRKKYPSAAKMGRLSFSEVEITPLCAEAVIVLGRWQIERENDHPHGRFTLLFQRTPSGWRIVHDHTT